MEVKNLLTWFFDIVKSIPQEFVTGILISFITMIITRILSWVGSYIQAIGNILERIQKIFSWSPEIKNTYTVIPSPEYKIVSKKRNVKTTAISDSGEIWGSIIVGLILSILALKYLKLYQSDIQAIIFLLSLFFIGLGIGFIILSAFSNKIQKSTLNFSVFGIALSFYTYYIATLLPELAKRIPDNLNLSMIFSDSHNFWTQIYMLAGLLLLSLEILVVMSLFLRMFIIKIDSIKSVTSTRYLIAKTSHFDSISGMIIMLVIFTITSYLLTSGKLLNFIFKINALG